MFPISGFVLCYFIYKAIGLGRLLAGIVYVLLVWMIFNSPNEDYSSQSEVVSGTSADKN